ncbi:MAG: Rrf2 family transcriptional regulator [Bacteroidota bacterium]
MVRLSKRVEYALIALRHIASQADGGTVTAREISLRCGIPHDLTAKVLQRLARSNLVVSHQGSRGGYRMRLRPEQVPVSLVISSIEGETPSLTRCMTDGPGGCEVFGLCTIREPLGRVQAGLERAFGTMTLAEIL